MHGEHRCESFLLRSGDVFKRNVQEMRAWTTRIAKELNVVGLINVQYCIKGGELYIIEANPRASRTVPFVAKAVGHPIASYAALLMSGKTLKDIGFTEEPKISHVAVKEVVLPFSKFPGADLLLGPEMRSTGMLL
jgi:carbamoyl-phosphate synthase large subunit